MEAGAPIPQGLANIERSRARRAERARSQRRRRRAAGGGVLVIVAAAIGLVVALSGAGGTAAQKKVKVPVAAGRRPCLGARRPQAAAILEYHVIAAAPAGVPYPLLYVTPAQFSAQMHAIADAGYRAVTLDQLWNNWHHEAPLPCGKPIVVSFDNGYYSQYDAALPVLRSLGWVGVENLQEQVRILVVDDEPNIVDVISMALRFEGFAVESAGPAPTRSPRSPRASRN
jgi:hypothetical protein